jgi:hypothetical protein
MSARSKILDREIPGKLENGWNREIREIGELGNLSGERIRACLDREMPQNRSDREMREKTTENGGNREIREIRELGKFSRKQIQTFSVVHVRVFSVVRGLKIPRCGVLGALFSLQSALFFGRLIDAFGRRLEVMLCV